MIGNRPSTVVIDYDVGLVHFLPHRAQQTAGYIDVCEDALGGGVTGEVRKTFPTNLIRIYPVHELRPVDNFCLIFFTAV